MNDDEWKPASPAVPLVRPYVFVGEPSEDQAVPHDRWTPDEDRKLIAAYQVGHGVVELARIFNRRPSAIESRLRTLALLLARLNRPGLYEGNPRRSPTSSSGPG